MTAYANLRNVLANMYRVGFYDVDADDCVGVDMIDDLTAAFEMLENSVYDKCRTNKDWDTSLHRIECLIRKAAATASHHDTAFIVNVVRDFYDADFYGIYIDAVECYR